MIGAALTGRVAGAPAAADCVTLPPSGRGRCRHRGSRSASRRLGLVEPGHGRDRALTPDAATLPLGEPAPDAELLGVDDRVFEAGLTDDAAAADLLGLPGRCAPFREEQVGVDAQAVGILLPTEILAVGDGDAHGGSFPPAVHRQVTETPPGPRPCNYTDAILLKSSQDCKGVPSAHGAACPAGRHHGPRRG